MRTVSVDKTLGAMIYGMLQATQLLEVFAALGWIRHLDISLALVVASLQKEGKAVDETVKSFMNEKAQVTTNKNHITNFQTELKNLKSRNPNLNTPETE